MKILVADDDAVLRNELAGLLREDGHDVVGASDGGEALRLVERESFDAAFLDLKMPKASGLEVLHRLRVARPETAVVVITGQGTIDAAVEATKAGAVDFVEKPYEVDAFRWTLRAVQEERRARLGGAPDPRAVPESTLSSDFSEEPSRAASIDPGADRPARTRRPSTTIASPRTRAPRAALGSRHLPCCIPGGGPGRRHRPRRMRARAGRRRN